MNAPYLDMSLPFAAGSLYSTVEDLLKWDQSLYEDKILSADSKKLMFTPGLGNYGFGLHIADVSLGKSEQKIKVIDHGGGINGFNCLISRAVEKRQTVILLDNVGLGQFQAKITNSIFSILNGQTVEPPKKSIAETLYQVALAKDVASVIAEYRRLKTEKPDMYDFSEAELNTLGYQLLSAKRVKDGIEILKLNVEVFPKSSNTYDSLGEAYLADNQKEPALANYRKAVELDPANANALRVVKRLEGNETKVNAAGFAAYVGEYQVTPNQVLTISKEGDKLFAQMSGQEKLEVEAVSESQFLVSRVKANVSFEKDAAGKVVALLLAQSGRSVRAPKIK